MTGEKLMSMYFLLGTLTNDGQRKLHQNRDLVVQVSRSLHIHGAEILGQYGVLGRYDFVMMVEADDNDAVASLSLELGIQTGLHLETLPAIALGNLGDIDNFHPDDETAAAGGLPDSGSAV